MITSFYSDDEIGQLGFRSIGEKCLISRNAKFYNTHTIDIGNNVRIDDFCILSGEIRIASYVHISAFCALYGAKGIVMGNYSGLSPRTTIFSAVDDFSGEYMINPMIPKEFSNVTGGTVIINDLVQIGSNTIIMPSVHIGTGAVTGAFSFVNKSLDNWSVYIGIPVKKQKERKRELVKYIEKLKK